MSAENIVMPVGMESIKVFLSEQAKVAKIHKYCSINPSNFLVYMDAGNGQTTLVEYITDVFIDENVRHFGSTDMYLEYKLDGSMDQLREISTDLNKSNAVYMDKYNGVVAIHLGALASKHNEPQIPFLIKNIVNPLKDAATFVFFLPTVTNRTLDQLADNLKGELEDMVTVSLSTYAKKDLVKIIVNKLGYWNIAVKDDTTKRIIEEMVIDQNISTAKEAVNLAKGLVQYADFHDKELVLELKSNDGMSTTKKLLLLGGQA